MHLSNRKSDFRGCDRIADSPAGHRICLRQTVYRYRPIAHSINRGKPNVLLSVEQDVLIDLVGYRYYIPFLAQIRDNLELVTIEHLPGGIVWGVDYYCLGIVVKCCSKLVGIK